MESIAVTRPEMGVLPPEKLVLSPFGALAQAFSEELLARAGFRDGQYPFVPLDLLEEKQGEAAPVPPVQPVVQVDLQLVLEALRRTENRTEQERVTERIVERILRLRERDILRSGPAASRPIRSGAASPVPARPAAGETVPAPEASGPSAAVPDGTQSHTPKSGGVPAASLISGGAQPAPAAARQASPAAPPSRRQTAPGESALPSTGTGAEAPVPAPGRQNAPPAASRTADPVELERLYALQQNFYSTVNQHIHFTAAALHRADSAQGEAFLPRPGVPGGLSRRTLAFSRRLQRLREEGQTTAPAAAPEEPLSGAALPAPDLPGWEKREAAMGVTDRRDIRRMAPEALSFPESGQDSAAPVSRGPEREAAALLRAAEQAARRITGKAAESGRPTPQKPDSGAKSPAAETNARAAQDQGRSGSARSRQARETHRSQQTQPLRTARGAQEAALTLKETSPEATPEQAAASDGIHRAETGLPRPQLPGEEVSRSNAFIRPDRVRPDSEAARPAPPTGAESAGLPAGADARPAGEKPADRRQSATAGGPEAGSMTAARDIRTAAGRFDQEPLPADQAALLTIPRPLTADRAPFPENRSAALLPGEELFHRTEPENAPPAAQALQADSPHPAPAVLREPRTIPAAGAEMTHPAGEARYSASGALERLPQTPGPAVAARDIRAVRPLGETGAPSTAPSGGSEELFHRTEPETTSPAAQTLQTDSPHPAPAVLREARTIPAAGAEMTHLAGEARYSASGAPERLPQTPGPAVAARDIRAVRPLGETGAPSTAPSGRSEELFHRTEPETTSPAAQALQTDSPHPAPAVLQEARTIPAAGAEMTHPAGEARYSASGAPERLPQTPGPAVAARDIRAVRPLGETAVPYAAPPDRTEAVHAPFPVPAMEAIVYRTDQEGEQEQSPKRQFPAAPPARQAPERTPVREAAPVPPETMAYRTGERGGAPAVHGPEAVFTAGEPSSTILTRRTAGTGRMFPDSGTVSPNARTASAAPGAGRPALGAAPVTAARDVRMVRFPREPLSAGPGGARERGAASAAAPVLPPETMTYRTEVPDSAPPVRMPAQAPPSQAVPPPQTASLASQTAALSGAGASGAAAAIRAALPDRRAGQDTYTWLWERLSGRTHKAVPAGRQPGTRPGQPASRAEARSIGRRTQAGDGQGLTPEPLELAYPAQSQDTATASQSYQQGGPAQSGSFPDSNYIRSLPDWAQRFLREGVPTGQTAAPGPMAAARPIAALPQPPQEGAFQWTAPDYRPPADVTLRTRPPEQEQTQAPQQSVHISDAEIRRTADRVYQIIEDRIRRERRRLGL